jgi:S-adenosylmethionine decarboxylase
MTIHITPEPECSYVSFESNIPLTSYTGLIQRVLNTFNPGKFIMTVFANRVRQAVLKLEVTKFKKGVNFLN